jgi:hypothetical protein
MKDRIQLNRVLELIPNCVSLYYVDRGDNLRNNIDRLQECVAANCLDTLYEELDDSISECESEQLRWYMEELQNDIAAKYKLEEDDAYRLVFETYEDKITDLLYDRNDSNAVGNLLKNTGEFSLFLDTGLEIEGSSYRWTRSEQTKWLNKIKRKLKITSNQWDKDIRMMLDQASYGGQLVVYFYDSVDTLLCEEEKDWKSVIFTNPAIAIINTGNGSGGHTHLEGHSFSHPFVRENLFIDKYFKYNYVSEVCGMDQDWCKDSQALFSFDSPKGKKSAVSPLAAQALQDRKYKEKYQKGGCTPGDMDIRRHRDVYFINDFPCGNKCPHCGTFWID